MKSKRLIWVVAGIFLLCLCVYGACAVDVTGCQVINTPGDYILRNNILNSSSTICINITSSDVTFDGSGYTIDGLDNSNTYGVYAGELLTNITVKNSRLTDWGYGGIYYYKATKGYIQNNTFFSNSYGIRLYSAKNHTISNNTLCYGMYGIWLLGDSVFEDPLISSNYNILTNNTVYNFTSDGIGLSASDYNDINNNVIYNSGSGINLDDYSVYNSLYKNTITNNTNGIQNNGDYSIIQENTILNNAWNGIYLSLSNYNNITNNSIKNNQRRGIYLYYSNNNYITKCYIENNSISGIRLEGSTTTTNKIFNNYFKNANNTEYITGAGTNTWNTTKTSGTNIIGGSSLGGNYWANPSGTGFSQTCTNAGDGICNAAYTIATNNIDNLPLTTGGGTPSITECGVISSPGLYTLQNDILNSTATECINISSSDVIFDGNGYTIDGTNSNIGIRGYNTSITLQNITIKNITITDWSYGIFLQNVTRSSLEQTIGRNQNPLSNSKIIYLKFSDGNSLINNHIDNYNFLNQSYYGLYLESSSDNSVKWLTVNNHSYAVHLKDGKNNTIDMAHLEGNMDGVKFEGSTHNSLINTTITGLAMRAVELGVNSNFNTITNTTIIGTESGGIGFLIDAYNTTIRDSSVSHIWVGIINGGNNSLINNNLSFQLEIKGKNNSILNNRIIGIGSSHGIAVWSCFNSTFKGNSISNNTKQSTLAGFDISGSNNNSFSDNIVYDNYNGFDLSNSSFNILFNNSLQNHTGSGIYMDGKYNTIQNNTIHISNYGIRIDSSNNTITGNNITTNKFGILLSGNSNVITDNYIRNSSPQFWGLVLSDSNYNTIFNNYFNNTNNSYVTGTANGNIWNITKNCTQTNIVDGTCKGGNYWATPNGTGFSEITPDYNGDGFCDFNYTLASGNSDNLPLKGDIPTANFIADVTQGAVTLNVHFTNTSQAMPTEWFWDFGDGTTSTDENPEHTYSTPGYFTVKLKIRSGEYVDWENKTSYITALTADNGWPIYDCGVLNESKYYVLQNSILNSPVENCINITASNLTFDGKQFTIDGSYNQGYQPSGIYIYAPPMVQQNITIRNVTLNDWFYGIYAKNIKNSTIENINATNNSFYGTELVSDYNSTVRNSIFCKNRYGLSLSSSRDSLVKTNYLCENFYDGASLYNISNTSIYDNTFFNNSDTNSKGIYYSNSRFTNWIVNNSFRSNNQAIKLWMTSNLSISQNNFTENINGIYTDGTTGNRNITIKDNTGYRNNGFSSIYYSNYNTIVNNTIYDSKNGYGIYLTQANFNNLTDNQIFNGVYSGIILSSSSNYNILVNNTAINNTNGIELSSSLYNNISNNTVFTNRNSGILLTSSDNNTITQCNAVNNTYGIFLSNSKNNWISNNHFNNTNNVNSFSCSLYPNYWNTSQISGTNIVNGPYLGGNFWIQPNGSGFSQITPDYNGDGFCDKLYNLTPTCTNNIDWLPLKGYLPTANFTANITFGMAPLAVQFTDTSSGSLTTWNWSFGDNTFSDEQNPIHVYDFAGPYTVGLNVTTSGGSNFTSRTNYIIVTVPKPIPDFSANVTSGIAPLPVSFADLSLNSPNGWAWFFGDENFTAPWTQVNLSAGWSARWRHTAVVMPDGSIILLGGIDDSGYKKDDVWRSTNNGSTWTQVNAGSRWDGRSSHSSVAMPNGSIVLMGGSNNTGNKNDVWQSGDYGSTWTQVNASAGWTARYAHSSVVMPDRSIVLMGGYDSSGYKNDTWRSEDTGTT